MGQYECLQVIKKLNRKTTSKELKKILGSETGRTTVGVGLNKLAKFGFVQREYNVKEHIWYYWIDKKGDKNVGSMGRKTENTKRISGQSKSTA